MSASVEVVSYPATVTVVDSAVTVSVVSQAVSVEAGSSGPQGVAGPTGPTGATGAAGSSGVVSVVSPITNTGTSSAAVLGFDQTANNTTNDTRYARLGAANAFTVGGHTITNTVAATIPLVVKGAASQSGNLTEWQSSAGTNLAFVTSAGSLRFAGSFTAGSAAAAGIGTGSIYARSSTEIGLAVRGAASQTANLQEWQNSAGSVTGRVSSAGSLFGLQVSTLNAKISAFELNNGGAIRVAKSTAAVSNPGADFGSLYLRDGTTAGTLKLVVRAGAAGAETTILDNIPQ